jgi:hypothetical protein
LAAEAVEVTANGTDAVAELVPSLRLTGYEVPTLSPLEGTTNVTASLPLASTVAPATIEEAGNAMGPSVTDMGAPGVKSVPNTVTDVPVGPLTGLGVLTRL